MIEAIVQRVGIYLPAGMSIEQAWQLAKCHPRPLFIVREVCEGNTYYTFDPYFVLVRIRVIEYPDILYDMICQNQFSRKNEQKYHMKYEQK